MQNEQMMLYGILGSPGCEDLIVEIRKPGPHFGKPGKIWVYNKPVCPGVTSRSPYYNIGGRGKYVVEVDLKDTLHPRSRAYCLHTYAQLNSVNPGTSNCIKPLDLAKRMRKNNEVSHTPWLAQYSSRDLVDVENTFKHILGIRIAKSKRNRGDNGASSTDEEEDDDDGLAEMRRQASLLVPDRGDGSDVSESDDDEEERASREKRRATRRRAIKRTRAKKLEELKALRKEQDEEESRVGVGEREWLVFCRTSELKRPPVLLELLASDFKVFEDEIMQKASEVDDKGRISVLRRRLGHTSKRKYALLRWKGLPPVQQSNEKVYEAKNRNLLIVNPSAPHPHPSCPVVRAAICDTDPVQRQNAVYLLKRVCHALRIIVHVEECETVEALVSCLVQAKRRTDRNCNLVFCSLDRLDGIGGDLLKRSLDACSVGVPTVLVSSPETLPELPQNGAYRNSRALNRAISRDELKSYPGHHGPGNEGLQESPTSLIYLPWTRAKISRVVTDFWLPLQQIAPEKNIRFNGNTSHTGKKTINRGKAPGPVKFLGKDAASTLAFNHKSGLDRFGMCMWYASNSCDLVRNIPSLEKRWIDEADASLKHGAKPLDLDLSGNSDDTSGDWLRRMKVRVQKKQVNRRMRENLARQSKIVLDLLPTR